MKLISPKEKVQDWVDSGGDLSLFHVRPGRVAREIGLHVLEHRVTYAAPVYRYCEGTVVLGSESADVVETPRTYWEAVHA
jgi:hypothetical protein